MTFALRLATRDDVDAIAFVMRESLREFGATVYDRAQVASAIDFVGRPDLQLIDDGTYFVVLNGWTIVGCGGLGARQKTRHRRLLFPPAHSHPRPHSPAAPHPPPFF